MNHSLLKPQSRLGATVLLLAIVVIGCGKDDPAESRDTPGGEATQATDESPSYDSVDIVTGMIDRYRSASTYANEGEVTVTYDDGTQHSEPMSIQLVRPNRLSLSVAGIQVQCDGVTYSARILDQNGANLLGQVLTTSSPPSLTSENALGDPVLAEFVSRRAAETHRLQLSPLLLLLDSQGFRNELKSMGESSKATDYSLDGDACYRIASDTSVMYVGKDDYLLRRLEMNSNGSKLVAEFRNARINEDLPVPGFQPLDLHDAVPVGFLVEPPRYIPEQLLGKRPGSFSFVDLDGNTVTQEQMQGHVSVLLWCINDDNCRQTLQAVSEVRDNNKHDDVRFYIVWLDPKLTETNALREQLTNWRMDVPVVRDPKLFSKDTFRIEQAPTVLVFDKQGTAQFGEMGVNPNLGTELPATIDRVRSGADVAGEQLKNYEQAIARFEQRFAEAQATSAAQVIEIPKAQVKDRTDPQRLVLTKLWTCTDITAPGNILTANDAGQPLILVRDGFRSVVQLGGDGKVVKRHELDLPEQQAVTYFRTATDNGGKRYFVASQVFGQQLHVFDDQWQKITSYPAEDDPNPGIWDVQFSNLDNDENGGRPELFFCFLERPIVIQVSLDGKQAATKRLFQPITSLAISQRGEMLVVASNGDILRFEDLDKPPRQTSGPGIHTLYAGRFPATQSANLCGLAYQDNDTMIAVGLSEKQAGEESDFSLEVAWTQELSATPFDNQMQFVTSGQLFGTAGGHWIFARPDSSIHIIGDDGKFRDSFQYGQPLTGISVVDLGSRQALLVATEDEVTAWTVEKISPTVP